MPSYPNQQYIKMEHGDSEKILLHDPDEKTVKFLWGLDWEPLLDIMIDLNPTEFKLWLYLWKWRGKEEVYAFSPADIEIRLGISETTTRRIKAALIEKGYLVKEKTNVFIFVPYPEGVRQRAESIRSERILKHSKISPI